MPAGAASLKRLLIIAGIMSMGGGTYWHGIAFVARHFYGFDAARTQVLYVVMGVVYTSVAFASGRISRALERLVHPRTQLALLLAVTAGALGGPLLGGEALLWASGTVVSLTMALIWPLIEAYLTRGRHGAEMRLAVGRFNYTWMGCVAGAMLVLGPVIDQSVESGFLGLMVLSLPMALLALGLPKALPAHESRLVDENVPPIYPVLLRSARVLLPLSYLLLASLSPLAPYILDRIDVPLLWATPATATWMAARILPVPILNRVRGWHGRWWPLFAGSLTMFGGIAGVLLAPSLPVVIASFAVFGFGAGTIYHIALYYALAVGQAEVDAASVHEGLIGAGYTVGPALALASAPLGGAPVLVAALGAIVVGGLVWTARTALRATPGRGAVVAG